MAQYGPILLVPSVVTKSCPIQVLTPEQYAPYLRSAKGTLVINDVTPLVNLYTAGPHRKNIQVVITSRRPEIDSQIPYIPYVEVDIETGVATPNMCPEEISVDGTDIEMGPTNTQTTRHLVIPSNFSFMTPGKPSHFVEFFPDAPITSTILKSGVELASPNNNKIIFYRCARTKTVEQNS